MGCCVSEGSPALGSGGWVGRPAWTARQSGGPSTEHESHLCVGSAVGDLLSAGEAVGARAGAWEGVTVPGEYGGPAGGLIQGLDLAFLEGKALRGTGSLTSWTCAK